MSEPEKFLEVSISDVVDPFTGEVTPVLMKAVDQDGNDIIREMEETAAVLKKVQAEIDIARAMRGLPPNFVDTKENNNE